MSITLTLTEDEEMELAITLSREKSALLSYNTQQGKRSADILVDIIRKLPTPNKYNWEETTK